MNRLNGVKHDQAINGLIQAATVQEQLEQQEIRFRRILHLDVKKAIYAQLVADAARDQIKAISEGGENTGVKMNPHLLLSIATGAADQFMVLMGMMQPKEESQPAATEPQPQSKSNIVVPGE